ncbi:hypothetical protein [uncultured Psychroserpens sp.]|uniref:hypothetical protein n=1 Tax=uncultured Psychroserpens sp. TaxID=255436 RepID=UPI002621BD57|nr:hypothetical protein [uncultured Psychroserpens sp.]
MGQKEIRIKKLDVKSMVILIFIPFLLTFIIEHFGDFKYHANTNGKNLPVNQIDILTINFHTPFGNTIWRDGSGYTYTDTVFKGGKFHSYNNKLPYYLRGLASDVIYPLVFSLILIVLFFLNKKYKIKLTS